MSAKLVPNHPTNAKIASVAHHLMNANPYTKADVYYVHGDNKAGIAVQWGTEDTQWGLFPMACLLQAMHSHLKSQKEIPSLVLASLGGAALALDAEHVNPEFMVDILKAMHEAAHGNVKALQLLGTLEAAAKYRKQCGDFDHNYPDNDGQQDSLSA